MKRFTAVLASTVLAAILIGAAQAAAAPQLDVKATWGDTNLPPGGVGEFTVQVRNLGVEATSGSLHIVDQLPAGVVATGIKQFQGNVDLNEKFNLCSGVGSETVECDYPDSVLPAGSKGQIINAAPTGFMPAIYIEVAISPGATGASTNTVTVSGGGLPEAIADTDQVSFGAPAVFGLVPGSFGAEVFDDVYPSGSPVRQAGDRPFEQRVSFDITELTEVGTDGTRYQTPHGLIKTAEVTLPRGFSGNPEAMPKCDPVDFASQGLIANTTGCPSNTQVGYLNVWSRQGLARYGEGPDGFVFAAGPALLTRVPIYSIEPPLGVPADFGFNAGGFVQAHIYPILDPAQNYAIKTVTPDISSLQPVRGSEVTFWGVPGDPAHDKFRYYEEEQPNADVLGAPFGGASIRPLLTNPVDCGVDNGGARIRLDSYQQQGEFTPVEEYEEGLNVEGCGDPRFRFEPDVSLQPTDRHAGAPTGLDVHLQVPQRNDEVKDADELYAANGFVESIPTPPVKKVVVTFPPGMTLNPSAAQGLATCASEQIGLGTDKPVTCPEASQYGSLTLHTPLLPIDEQPEGFIYVAKQGDNPFHDFLALYLVIQEPDRGILVKLPGRAQLDPATGQITTTFDDLPQFPVDDFQLAFKGGVRAALVQPSTCGRKTITAEFFSWHEPGTPHTVNNSYEITQKPDGSPCVNSLGARPFGPGFEAGTTNNSAGSHSPFVLRLTRTDDDQEFSQVGVTLPPGLAAKFAGVGVCSDAAIAQAESRTKAGDGLLEQVSPSCPASSEIGATQVGTGVGVPLTYVPGKVYLAGPYKGAPLSMVVISPAVVGPYDLGVIAVRTALNVDPTTAQGSAVSDPFPQIFQGIPVRIRDIRLELDRPEFTLNPTSCAEKRIDARLTGTGGDVNSTADDTVADLSNRFQAADCASLGFDPKLSFRLFGGTNRGAHPKLRATVTYPKGPYANIAAASVALPHSVFLDQGHIGTVCTRVQFAADACPTNSIYGNVVAKTPLFDQALRGPIYLRSSSNLLPDLVAVLKGPPSQPVEVNLVGRIDSVNQGIRNTFSLVPDAPVSRATFSFLGGRKGLLINSANLCAKTNRVTVKLVGQNGKRLTQRPAMQNSCKKGRKGNRKRPKR